MSTVCVYCGSNPGAQPEYVEAASQVGKEIATLGHRLVYGGARTGLMGAVADAALEQGGDVIGVLPLAIAEMELAHDGLTELHVVDSMHERKALMANLSDCFLALPGGLGTLEELAEIFVWIHIGLHTKPCGILNVNGFHDPLLAFLQGMVTQGFLRAEQLAELVVLEQPSELAERLIGGTSRSFNKWLK